MSVVLPAVDDLALTGPTLRVRIPREEDAHALFEQASDPEVTRWFSWGPYSSEAEARSYLARLPAQRARGEHLDLVVEHLDGGSDRHHGPGRARRPRPPRGDRLLAGPRLVGHGRQPGGQGAHVPSRASSCSASTALGAYSNVEHAARSARWSGSGFTARACCAAITATAAARWTSSSSGCCAATGRPAGCRRCRVSGDGRAAAGVRRRRVSPRHRQPAAAAGATFARSAR